ncbi:MAG: glycosyltransferase [Parachlamydiales bacterium]|jgi:glycosyltransferase involved in cell wall biosynthesis
MVKKITLFMPPYSQYNVLHHFTKQLGSALERNGVECHILEAKYNNPKPFLEELFKEKPDATFSFNGLMPDEKGNFFSDMIKIPHVAALVDSPNRYLPLINSKYTIISCADRFGCDFFKGINFPKTFFLPHAVGRDEKHPAEAQRPIDVLVLATCMEYEDLLQSWKKKYPPAICAAMQEAIDASLNDNHTTYVQAFVSSIDKQLANGAPIKPEHLDYPQIFDDLESYLRAKDRIETIRNIHDVQIHIYGDGVGSNWKSTLSGKKNVTLHSSADFTKALDLMKQAKIIINSNPHFKNGAHERIFYGLNLGALVITNDNTYLREIFEPNKSIVLSQFGQWQELNDNIKHFLSNEKERQNIVHNAQSIIQKNHTWDNNAQILIKELPTLLSQVQG